jgi:hypothetical protein
MFNDGGWIEERTRRQRAALVAWLQRAHRVAVIELGAGTAIPTVRRFSERYLPRVIRINPGAPELPRGQGASLALGALEGIRALVARLGR